MAKKSKAIFTLKDLAAKGIRISNANGLDVSEIKELKGKPKIASKKTVINGVKYDSELEAHFAQTALLVGLPFLHHAKTFTVQEGFVYRGEKVRPITYTPDFTTDKWVVEVKGFANDIWPVRRKMFLRYLYDNNFNIDFRELRNKQEIEAFIYEKINQTPAP